jgi:hypothetical protein
MILSILTSHVENQRHEEIYACVMDHSMLTVAIGAKCSDGISLIAYRRDVMIERDNVKRYLLDNLLLKVSKSIKRFNASRCTPFKVFMARQL